MTELPPGFVLDTPGSSLDPRGRDLAIRTIYGEAANEPDQGQAAVAAVIKNRLDSGRFGSSIPHVVLAPNQFEPWNSQGGRSRMAGLKPDDPQYQKIGGIVDQVFGGQMEDPTGGATHFVAPQAQAALGRPMPSWAQGEGQPIGRHTFFAPEGRVQTAQGGAGQLPPGFVLDAAPAASDGAAVSPQPDGSTPLRFTVRPAGVQEPPPADNGGQFAAPLASGQNIRTAREGDSPAVATPGEAAARGFVKAGTFNFIDELNGLAAAGGLDPNNPKHDEMTAALAILKGAYGRLTGNPEADAAYRVGKSQASEKETLTRDQQPGAMLAGEVVGSLATAPAGFARAAGWGGRALQAGATGGVMGAVSGAGEGDGLGDRAGRAVTGGAIGGTIGAVASPVIDLASRGAGRVAQEAGRYLFPNVEQRAARMVDNAARSAAQVDPAARTRLTPAQAAATPQSAVADVTGEPGRAIARWAANASPEARETLNAMIDPRFQGQAHRITGWLDHTFNFPNATAQQEAVRQTASQVNNARYAIAMRDGAGGVWDAELQRLSGAPAIQQAARDAIPSLSNRSITEGFRAPRQNPLTVGPDGRASLTTTPNGNQIVPDLRFWDQVKKNIDAQIGKAETQNNRAKVQELTALNNDLVAHLDTVVPTYAQARAGAAHFFGADNMLQAGQAFVTQNFGNREVRQQLARATPTERQLFQDGFISRYIETLNKVGDRRDVLNKVADNPAAREKLDMVLGPQRSRELEAILRVEGVMNLFRNQVQGGPTTARQLVELGAVGTYGGVGAYMSDPQTMLQSAIAGAFVARGRNIDQRVARRVAEMLVSHDPAVFQRGLNMVARNARFMDNIRGMDQQIARIAGQQGGHVPAPAAIQASGIGRAEDNQDNVPRPPGQ